MSAAENRRLRAKLESLREAERRHEAAMTELLKGSGKSLSEFRALDMEKQERFARRCGWGTNT